MGEQNKIDMQKSNAGVTVPISGDQSADSVSTDDNILGGFIQSAAASGTQLKTPEELGVSMGELTTIAVPEEAQQQAMTQFQSAQSQAETNINQAPSDPTIGDVSSAGSQSLEDIVNAKLGGSTITDPSLVTMDDQDQNSGIAIDPQQTPGLGPNIQNLDQNSGAPGGIAVDPQQTPGLGPNIQNLVMGQDGTPMTGQTSQDDSTQLNMDQGGFSGGANTGASDQSSGFDTSALQQQNGGTSTGASESSSSLGDALQNAGFNNEG